MKKGLTLQYLKGITVPAARGKAKKCMLCDKDFGVFMKEHQCKRCKRAVCDKCSPNKAFMIKKQQLSKQPHRQCNVCKEESDFMKKFIDQEKVVFLKDTLSLGWLTSFGYTQETAKKEYDQARYDLQQQNQKDQSEYNRMQKEIELVFQELVQCYNYSLKEFFYYLLKDFEPNMINTTIQKILGTFLLNYPEVGYSPDQAFILLYLLSFSSESSAYTLLTLIYAQMVPTYTYPNNQKATKYDYAYEIDKVINILESGYKLQNQDKPIVRSFLNATLDKYLQTLTLNFFLQESTHFILDQMFKNPKNCYDDLLKSLASTFSNRIDDMRKNPQNHDETELLILRSTKKAIIQTGYLNTIHLSVQIPNQKNIPRKSAILQKQKTIIQDSPFQQVQRSDSIENNDLFKQVQSDNERLQVEISNQEKTIDQLRKRLQEQQATIEDQTEQLQQYQNLQNNNVINQDEMSEIQQEIQNYAKNNQEFLDLRRETMQLTQKGGNKIELSKLKQYIDKLEHSLMMEHKISNELKQTIENLRGNKTDTKQHHQHDSGDHEEDDAEAQNQPSMLQVMMSKNQQLREQVEKLQEQLQDQEKGKANQEEEHNNQALQEQIDALNQELQQLKTEKKEQEDLMFQEIDSLTKENKNFKEQIVSQREQIKELNQQKDQLQLKLEEAKQIESERNMLLLSLEEMQKTFNENKQLKSQVEAAKKSDIEKIQLAEKLEALDKKYQQQQIEYNQMEAKNQQHLKELERLALEMIIYEKLKLEIQEQQTKLSEYEKQLNDKDLTIYNLNEQIRIDKERQEFLMDQENDEEEKLQGLQKELDENRQQLLAFKQQTIINQDIKRKQIEDLTNQNDSLNLQLDQAKQQIQLAQGKFDEQAQELRNEIQSLKDQNDEIKQQNDKQIAQAEQEITDLKQKNQKMNEEIQLLILQNEENKQKFESHHKNQQDSHIIVVNDLQTKLTQIVEEITRSQQTVASKQQELDNLNQLLRVKQDEINSLLSQNQISKQQFETEQASLQQINDKLNLQIQEEQQLYKNELEKQLITITEITLQNTEINQILNLEIQKAEHLEQEKTQQLILLEEKAQEIKELENQIREHKESHILSKEVHEKEREQLILQINAQQQELQTLQSELDQKNDQIALLQQQLVRVEQSLGIESQDLNQKLKQSEDEILQIKLQIKQLEQHSLVQEQQINDNNLKISELEDKNNQLLQERDQLVIHQEKKEELSMLMITEIKEKHDNHILKIQEQYQEQLKILQNQILELQESQQQQKVQIETYEAMIDELKKQEQIKIEQIEDQKQKFSLEIQELSQINNGLQIKYDSLLAEQELKLNDSNQVLLSLRNEHDVNLKTIKEDHRLDLQLLSNQITQLEAEKQQLNTEIQTVSSNLQELQRQQTELTQILADRDNQIQELNQIKNNQSQRHDDHINQKVQKIAELELLIIELRNEHQKHIEILTQEQQEQIIAQLEQISQLKEEGQNKDDVITSLRDKIDQINSDKESMKYFYYEKIENLESQVVNLEYFQQQNETTKFELEKQINDYKQRIQELFVDKETISNQKQELQGQLEQLQIQLESCNNQHTIQLQEIGQEKEGLISSYSNQIMKYEEQLQIERQTHEALIVELQNQLEQQQHNQNQMQDKEKQKQQELFNEQEVFVNSLKEEIQNLKGQIIKLNDLIEIQNQEMINLNQNITKQQVLIDSQQMQLGSNETQLKEYQDQIEEKNKENQDLDQINREQKEKLIEFLQLEQLYNDLKIKFEYHSQLQSEGSQEIIQLKEFNNQLEDKCRQLQKQCEQYQTDLEISQQKFEAIELSYLEQQDLNEKLKNEIIKLNDQQQEIQAKLRYQEESYRELTLQLEYMNNESKDKDERIDREREMFSQSLEQQVIKQKELQLEIDKQTDNINQLNELNNSLQQQINQQIALINDQIQQNTEIKGQLNNKQAELEQIQQFIQISESKVLYAEEKLKEFINSQGDDIKNLMQQQQIKDLEIQQLLNNISEQNQLRYDLEQQLQQTQLLLDNKGEKISVLQETISVNEEKILKQKEKIKQLQNQINNYETQQEFLTQNTTGFCQTLAKSYYQRILNQSINQISVINLQNQASQDQSQIQQLQREQLQSQSKISELIFQIEKLQQNEVDIIQNQAKQSQQQQMMIELLQEEKLFKEQTEMEIQLMAKQQMNHQLKQQIDQRDYQILELQDKQVESSAWYEEQLDIKNNEIKMFNQEVEQLVNRINNYKILKDLVIKHFQINQEVIENLQFDVIEQIFCIFKQESSQLLVQKEEVSRLQQINKLLEAQINALQQELQNQQQLDPYLQILNDDKEKEIDSEKEEQLYDILFDLFDVEDKAELFNKCKQIQDLNSTNKQIIDGLVQSENKMQELNQLFQDLKQKNHYFNFKQYKQLLEIILQVLVKTQEDYQTFMIQAKDEIYELQQKTIGYDQRLFELDQIIQMAIKVFEIEDISNLESFFKNIIIRRSQQKDMMQKLITLQENEYSQLFDLIQVSDNNVWIQVQDIIPIIQKTKQLIEQFQIKTQQSDEQIKSLEDEKLQFQLKFEEQKEKNAILQSEVDMYYEQSLKSSRKISQFQSKEKIILDSFYMALKTVPWLTQQQIYSFSDNSKIKPSPIKDLEDAKMLMEVKNSQILQLKGMMIEKQNQLSELNKHMIVLKDILQEYHSIEELQ